LELNKKVLITGGSSGIGKRLTADFLRSGAQVIVVADKPDRVHDAVQELSVISPLVTGVVCDIGDRHSVLAMKDQVLRQYGCPDILINNAGFATYKTFAELDIEEIEQLVNVNLVGAMRCTRAFLPHMIERRSGAIVNMASIAGRLVMTPNGTYSAAKHGLVAWSETLRYELAGYDIQVNVICPGRVETPFFDHESFKTRAPRVESRYTITVEDVSRATRRAIIRNRFITYMPRVFGLVVWLTNALPFLVKPLYGMLLTSRIRSSAKSV
jgi:short-subunit dehydrogenase